MAFNLYRNTSVSNSAITILTNLDPTVKIVIKGFNIINPNNSDVYIKFYDVDYTSVTVGTTTPKSTLMIPHNGSIYEPWVSTKIINTFDRYVTFAVTTGLSDTSNTAPTSNIMVELMYETEGI